MARKVTGSKYANRVHPDLAPLEVPVDSLTLDPDNARNHDNASVEAIRRSYQRFGQRKPIVVQRKGRIVRAGNGQLKAARLLGWKSIAAIFVDEDDSEATGYAIADNRTAELSEWNSIRLAELLRDLPAEVSVATGYTANEIESIAGLYARQVTITPVNVSKPIAWTWMLFAIPTGSLNTVQDDVDRLARRDGVLTFTATAADPPTGAVAHGKPPAPTAAEPAATRRPKIKLPPPRTARGAKP